MSNDINIGAISEALNNKVDLNQLNTSSAGKSYGSSWALPSHNYESVTVGASATEYIAPANGYFVGGDSSTTSSRLTLWNTSCNIIVQAHSTGGNTNLFVPCQKNDSVYVYYDANPWLRFVYAVGEEVSL